MEYYGLATNTESLKQITIYLNINYMYLSGGITVIFKKFTQSCELLHIDPRKLILLQEFLNLFANP